MSTQTKIYLTALFILFLAPLAMHAAGPSVYVDLSAKDVVITDLKKTQHIVDYKKARDLQALRIERNDEYSFVVLRVKKDLLRLYLYDDNGNKIDSQKVFSAKDGKSFAQVQLRAKTIDGKKRIQVRAIRTNAEGQSVKLVRKRYRVHQEKDNPIKYKSKKKNDISYPNLTGLSDADAGLKLFNYYRKSSGLMPVKRHGYLDEKCLKHANYMKTNDIIEHYEDPDLPGYTKDGDEAGRSSNITRQPRNSFVDSLKILMNGTYHRILQMVAGLEGIGFGIDGPSATGFYFGCLEISTEYDGGVSSGNETNVTYFNESQMPLIKVPGVNEINVPRQMNGGEWPDPLYNFGSNYPAGYPITVTLTNGYSDLYLQLFHPNGEQIFAYFQPPGDQNDPNGLYQGISYSLIPAAPLAAQTQYRVRMTGKKNGDDFTEEWHFTTE